MQIPKIFLLTGLVVSMASGCNDFIERPTPAQSLPSDAAFSDVPGLQTALVGAYDAVQNADFGAAGIAMNSSILSDNADWRGSFPSYAEMYERQLTPSNAEVNGLWYQAYLAINQANLVIRGVETIDDPNLTEDVAAQLRGEALFIRAFSHFELVKAFAQPYGADSGSDLGVPVITTPTATSGDITFPARNTVAEVYNAVISDLMTAQDLLGPDYEYGFASGTAATALLADVYFQQRNYEQAAALAEEVINTPGYSLTDSPEQPFFNEGTSEEIFAVVSTVQDNPGVNGSLATFHNINGRGGDIVVNQALQNQGYFQIITDEEIAAAGGDSLVDLRLARLAAPNAAGFYNVEKYDDFANNSDDLIVLRLATYYLMRAEALVRLEGVNEESIELLNTIRNRSLRRVSADGTPMKDAELFSYSEDDFDSPEELIDAIVLERWVELAFEPNRLNDLKRLMRSVRGLPYDSDNLVFPIPQRELDANDQLVQNSGY
ncbi:RagB/SusD family nutrient uptake outer membrane protein [Lewinella sp. IMCC34183]|uniref:RagB/SusD family nutrient uptake outer membrane protein n=1 Tax=Lewinella sp. IMCC34183 TaxID=2248762 RepID=UPI000E257D3C|nr:RagB/SusD family nutrient uptake outer membrane protein [Lewinella sp. IMCC34183]